MAMKSEVGTSVLRPQQAMIVIAGPSSIVTSSGGRRVEFVDELDEFVLEGRLVVVRVLANEGDDFAMAVGSLSVLTSGLGDHPEAIPPVMQIGDSGREALHKLVVLRLAAGADALINPYQFS